jgi:trans-2,3-dihydro-3-hydroxyanthranilate isomerase
MRRHFYTLDVFTDRRFTGNPLAVVLESDGLDTPAMQAIAREFNHPETVFVFPPASAGNRARLRIFTPVAELPFAGHPTVGTAVLLGTIEGGTAAREIVLEEKIGSVRCRVVPAGGQGRATFVLPQLPQPAGAAPDVAAIAAGLSIAPEDIGFDRVQPACWSAGLSFTFVPLRGLDAIRRCRADPVRFEQAFGRDGPGRVYMFCKEVVEAGNAYHARMFAPGMGIAEDPATGSAVAGFAGLLAEQGLADGEHTFRIEQGYEMGRPSVIDLTLAIASGKLAAGSIGGGAVIVTEGRIEA